MTTTTLPVCRGCGASITGRLCRRTGTRAYCSVACYRGHRRGFRLVEGDHYAVDQRGCWLWLRKLSPYGYGVLSRVRDGRERTLQAHRVAYEIHVGPIPADGELHHTCEVKCCVNPTHLELITSTEHHRIPNGHVKLTWARVREIRELHAAGESCEALARAFGVHPSHVSRVVRHKLWA